MTMQPSAGRVAAVRTMVAVVLVAGVATMVTAGAAGAAESSSTKTAVANAKKALIVLKDLPKGWTSTPATGGNSSIPGASQLATCLGVPASVINDDPPSANSPEFDSANHLMTVNDSIAVSPSVKSAKADYNSLANAKTPGCLTTVLNGASKASLASEFGTGATIGTIDVTRAPNAEFAGHGADFTAFLPVTVQGQTLNVQLTIIDYLKGTENETVTFTAIETPFSTALAKHLTTVAVKRF
jgi:hypothetical protein